MKAQIKQESPYHGKKPQLSPSEIVPILSSMQKKARCSAQIIVLDDIEQEPHRIQEKMQVKSKEPLRDAKIKKQEDPNHVHQVQNEVSRPHQSNKIELGIKRKLGKRRVFPTPKHIKQATGEQKWTRLRKKTNPFYNSQVEECSKLQSFLLSHSHSKASSSKIYRQLRLLRNSKYTAN